MAMRDVTQRSLSRRQAEIANLVMAGKSSREIAEMLLLSPRTVDHHLETIFNKLGVGSRVELVAALLRPGPPEPSQPAVPPLRSVDAIPNNLPRRLTSFIGREAEISEVTALIGSYQLVTLVGSGGVGKTRTALTVAQGVFGAFPDGVWFVELAPLLRGDCIAGTVAQALGLALAADGDPVANLTRSLRSKRLLLVFDNCEHLVADVAKIVAMTLHHCHTVKILATSRQPLRIRGEATYRMPPLSVPPSTGSAPLSAAAALQYVAVALFEERAQAVDHRFTLTDENTRVIAQICRRLDGIPLAIELAAARVTLLRPQQLRDRLDECFRVLMGGGRDSLPRHQSFSAVVDWSHDLLDEREQRLFRRLGIFANGFTLEAASAVGGGNELDTCAVLDVLASLVDKSLVIADPTRDSARYHLLESTRVYAAEKLVAAGESDALASRHLRYLRDCFVTLRREREELQHGIEAVFATELDDVRVALDGALVRRELADGAELLAALGTVCWLWGGLGREGIARCEAFLAELPRSELRLLAELGVLLTHFLCHTGRYTRALDVAVTAIEDARACGDGQVLAVALGFYAVVLIRNADVPAAECALSEAEAIHGVSPLRRLLLADCRAQLSMLSGDLDLAASTLERMREQFRSARFRANEVLALFRLSDVEFRRQKYQRAAELLYEAASLTRSDEASAYLPAILVFLGQVLASSGAIAAAIGPAIEAITLSNRRDPGHFVGLLAIELLADIAAAQGDLDRSARLFGYADVSLVRIGFSRDFVQLGVYERLMTRLREQLASDELARLTTEGSSLTPEAAIALALEMNAGRSAT